MQKITDLLHSAFTHFSAMCAGGLLVISLAHTGMRPELLLPVSAGQYQSCNGLIQRGETAYAGR
jgi:hypothetical protein